MQPLVSVAMAAAVSSWNSHSGFFTWLIPTYLPSLILMLSFVQQIWSVSLVQATVVVPGDKGPALTEPPV